MPTDVPTDVLQMLTRLQRKLEETAQKKHTISTRTPADDIDAAKVAEGEQPSTPQPQPGQTHPISSRDASAASARAAQPVPPRVIEAVDPMAQAQLLRAQLLSRKTTTTPTTNETKNDTTTSSTSTAPIDSPVVVEASVLSQASSQSPNNTSPTTVSSVEAKNAYDARESAISDAKNFLQSMEKLDQQQKPNQSLNTTTAQSNVTSHPAPLVFDLRNRPASTARLPSSNEQRELLASLSRGADDLKRVRHEPNHHSQSPAKQQRPYQTEYDRNDHGNNERLNAPAEAGSLSNAASLKQPFSPPRAQHFSSQNNNVSPMKKNTSNAGMTETSSSTMALVTANAAKIQLELQQHDIAIEEIKSKMNDLDSEMDEIRRRYDKQRVLLHEHQAAKLTLLSRLVDVTSKAATVPQPPQQIQSPRREQKDTWSNAVKSPSLPNRHDSSHVASTTTVNGNASYSNAPSNSYAASAITHATAVVPSYSQPDTAAATTTNFTKSQKPPAGQSTNSIPFNYPSPTPKSPAFSPLRSPPPSHPTSRFPSTDTRTRFKRSPSPFQPPKYHSTFSFQQNGMGGYPSSSYGPGDRGGDRRLSYGSNHSSTSNTSYYSPPPMKKGRGGGGGRGGRGKRYASRGGYY